MIQLSIRIQLGFVNLAEHMIQLIILIQLGFVNLAEHVIQLIILKLISPLMTLIQLGFAGSGSWLCWPRWLWNW